MAGRTTLFLSFVALTFVAVALTANGREVIRGFAPEIPVVSAMEQVIARETATHRGGEILLGAYGVLALLATWVTSRRAAWVDPADVLREP